MLYVTRDAQGKIDGIYTAPPVPADENAPPIAVEEIAEDSPELATVGLRGARRQKVTELKAAFFDQVALSATAIDALRQTARSKFQAIQDATTAAEIAAIDVSTGW